MTKRFLEQVELWLSGAGLAVVWMASVLIAPGGTDIWKVAAVTALLVSVIHGVLFWLIRRRQRMVRNHTIHEIREMLGDQVKNQLAVIGMIVQDEQLGPDAQRSLREVSMSVDTISKMVDSLSEESLHDWKTEYHEAVANATDLDPAYVTSRRL